MWPDRVSNPVPLTYESGALPTALCEKIEKILHQQVNASGPSAEATINRQVGRSPKAYIMFGTATNPMEHDSK